MTAPLPPLDAESIKRFIDEDAVLSVEEYVRRLEVTIVVHALLCEQFHAHFPNEYARWMKHAKS